MAKKMTKAQARRRFTEASDKIMKVLGSNPISNGWISPAQFGELVKLHNKLESYAKKLK